MDTHVRAHTHTHTLARTCTHTHTEFVKQNGENRAHTHTSAKPHTRHKPAGPTRGKHYFEVDVDKH